MKNIQFIGISLALLSVLWACEKEIVLKQEEVEPRIVVNSIFSANDTIWVQLSESRNVLFEGELPVITDAALQLTDGNGSVLGEFIHESDGNYYMPTVLPVAGNRYGIIASKAGLKSVSAFSSAPNLINVTSIDTVSFADVSEMEFTIKFSDDVTETNYYSISIASYNGYPNELGEVVYYENNYFTTKEFYVVNGGDDIGGDGTKYDSEFYFTDELLVGADISFKGRIYYFSDSEEPRFFVVKVASLSEDLYKYKVTYANYLNTQGSPFAEPVRVYSNVENGFGIFGGGSISRDTLFVE